MRRRPPFSVLPAWPLWLVLLCLPLLATPADAREPEQIRDFHSDITVHPDGSLTVVETILVNARGRNIRHGIYRDFPTRYPGRFGTLHTTGFELLSVERDGRAEPWHSENLDNGVRTYIGDRNLFISESLHRYTIRYRSDRQLGFDEDHDQLYWNITGNQWAFPIRRASATVHLPDGIANRLLS
ncbi:MAG: DUF2207 domain-containing protein, partial [Pseudomonadota bacterium]|nr:DUF2207 domain-containing protein [Pseudomonadota bacterium]